MIDSPGIRIVDSSRCSVMLFKVLIIALLKHKFIKWKKIEVSKMILISQPKIFKNLLKASKKCIDKKLAKTSHKILYNNLDNPFLLFSVLGTMIELNYTENWTMFLATLTVLLSTFNPWSMVTKETPPVLVLSFPEIHLLEKMFSMENILWTLKVKMLLLE